MPMMCGGAVGKINEHSLSGGANAGELSFLLRSQHRKNSRKTQLTAHFLAIVSTQARRLS